MKKFFFFICIFAVVSAIWFVYTKQQLSKPASQLNKQNDQQILQQVSRLTQLPQEQPQIATVRDEEVLKVQPQFQNIKNGDKLLIFLNSAKTYIYRPSEHKIVDILTIQPAQQATSAASDSTKDSN